MAIARLGTCGSLNVKVKCGSVVIAHAGSVMIARMPDAFGAGLPVKYSSYSSAHPLIRPRADTGSLKRYHISQPVLPDQGASHDLNHRLQRTAMNLMLHNQSHWYAFQPPCMPRPYLAPLLTIYLGLSELVGQHLLEVTHYWWL